MTKARVLVVEDDESIVLGLQMNLESEGYIVEKATDGMTGLDKASSEEWDLVILDIMLPKLNGYELLSRLRERKKVPPVLMLSARSGDIDKVMGLDLGAEDYMTKPFSIAELLARVRVILRRSKVAVSEATICFGDIVIDVDTREVRKSGELVELTATEFDVLMLLWNVKGRILSRQQILDQLHGGSHHGTHRTVDNFVAQLRAKLEGDPSKPKHLLTIRGVGYRLQFEK
ncbi:MAG: response regulator transcription factor [Myxococcales bacterium]|nr:MAG: response regulator transcription factor [Myxococcales bacterium]